MGIISWIAKRYEEKLRKKEGENYVNIVKEAREINSALNAAGLGDAVDEGISLRKIAILELLEKKYPFFKNYKQDAFIKISDKETRSLIKAAQKEKLLIQRK